MKTIEVVKLGTICTDRATKLKGTLTHWIIGMGGQITYLFQPKILDDEGQPVERLFLEVERLTVKPKDFEKVQVPVDILGTIVTEDASGFTGMAISFIRHINGCFHVTIQPAGLQPKDGSPIKMSDFDLRSCSGKKIQQLSEKALKVSKKKKPSPTNGSFNVKPVLRSICGGR